MNIVAGVIEAAGNVLDTSSDVKEVLFDELHKSPIEVSLPIGTRLVLGRKNPRRQVQKGMKYVEIDGDHPQLSREQVEVAVRQARPDSSQLVLGVRSLGKNKTVVWLGEDTLEPGKPAVVLNRGENRSFADIRHVILAPSVHGQAISLRVIQESMAHSSGGKWAGGVTLRVGIDKTPKYEQALSTTRHL